MLPSLFRLPDLASCLSNPTGVSLVTNQETGRQEEHPGRLRRVRVAPAKDQRLRDLGNLAADRGRCLGAVRVDWGSSTTFASIPAASRTAWKRWADEDISVAPFCECGWPVHRQSVW